MVKFKDFSRPLSVFQELFKVNLIFKDFSRQTCILKYLKVFSHTAEPKENLIQSLHAGKFFVNFCHLLFFSKLFFSKKNY